VIQLNAVNTSGFQIYNTGEVTTTLTLRGNSHNGSSLADARCGPTLVKHGARDITGSGGIRVNEVWVGCEVGVSKVLVEDANMSKMAN
jgi:hypothetical protein